MKRALVLAATAVAATQANAIVMIDIVATPAPNVFGSASYQPWFDNAQTAIRTGQITFGSGFSTFNNVSGQTRNVTEAAVTGFNSWNGVADTTNELGQRMHFVYRVYESTGADVQLSNIRGVAYGSDWRDSTGDDFGPFNFDGTTQFDSLRRVGFLSDGTRITSGNQGVKEIVGTFGLGYEPDLATGTNQEKLDDLLGRMSDPSTGLSQINATISYEITGGGLVTQSQFVNFAPVPEPATMAVLAIGALAVARRRKKK